MRVFLSRNFKAKYKKLIKKDKNLKTKIKESVAYFRLNPTHPHLKLHRLKGKQIDNWSFSVTDDIRIIITFIEGDALFINIGTYDQVYKK